MTDTARIAFFERQAETSASLKGQLAAIKAVFRSRFS